MTDFNPLKGAIQKFSDKILQPPLMDQVANGCPIAGPVNVTDFEFERDIKEYISPFFHSKDCESFKILNISSVFILEGIFMIYLRFHTKSNVTYIEIQNTLEVRPSGITDYIFEYITLM